MPSSGESLAGEAAGISPVGPCGGRQKIDDGEAGYARGQCPFAQLLEGGGRLLQGGPGLRVAEPGDLGSQRGRGQNAFDPQDLAEEGLQPRAELWAAFRTALPVT